MHLYIYILVSTININDYKFNTFYSLSCALKQKKYYNNNSAYHLVITFS